MIVGIDGSEFHNELYKFENINDKLTFDQTLWGGKYIGYADLYSFRNDEKIFKMIKHQFGIDLKSATSKEREMIMNTPEYEKMSTYPSKESIKLINGVIVVKI